MTVGYMTRTACSRSYRINASILRFKYSSCALMAAAICRPRSGPSLWCSSGKKDLFLKKKIKKLEEEN